MSARGVERFCDQGCYWPCEHGAVAPLVAAGKETWRLGPATGPDARDDDLDALRWQLATGITVLRYCTKCGGSFGDATEHAREHERLRQIEQARGDDFYELR